MELNALDRGHFCRRVDTLQNLPHFALIFSEFALIQIRSARGSEVTCFALCESLPLPQLRACHSFSLHFDSWVTEFSLMMLQKIKTLKKGYESRCKSR